MHIVIMGCGRVGSTLAHILEDRGDSIAVIDRDPDAFRKLRSSFKGDKITGIGFDRTVLTQAGTERAAAFVERHGSTPKTARRLAAKGFDADTLESVLGLQD